MTSSPEDAIRLLKKWETEASLIHLNFSDATPDSPVLTFVVEFEDAKIREVSSASLVLAAGRSTLRLDLAGAFFVYMEPRDRDLSSLDEEARGAVEEMFEGCLLIVRAGRIFSLCNVRLAS